MDANSPERAANIRTYARGLRGQAAEAEQNGEGSKAFWLLMDANGWEDTAREALGEEV